MYIEMMLDGRVGYTDDNVIFFFCNYHFNIQKKM